MSNSEDNRDLGNKMDQDVPYAVGHKKPPLHTRFPPGQSGNPKGRPKGRSKDKDLVNLGNLVMKEPAALHAWLKAKNSASVISRRPFAFPIWPFTNGRRFARLRARPGSGGG